MEKKYKEFRIGELFSSLTGDTDLKKEDLTPEGIPLITSGLENSGVAGLTNKKAKIIPKNTITVDMFGNVYYRDFQYKLVTHARVFALIPLFEEINEKIGLYFVASLKYLSKLFNYNNMCSFAKIKGETISLPLVDGSSDQIDFEYMAERISELEAERISELEAFLVATGLNDYELTEDDRQILTAALGGQAESQNLTSLDSCLKWERKYKQFRVGDLFDIHPTKAYKLSNDNIFSPNGSTPVASNSSTSNGIGGYSMLDPTESGNIITFSDTTTGPDTIFYQGHSFIGYPHVQGLYPHAYKEYWSQKSMIYVIAAIQKASGDGWSYANKYTRKFVSDLRIILPITASGSPDFEYMERYIKAIEKTVIADVVKYKDQVIEETKKVVANNATN